MATPSKTTDSVVRTVNPSTAKAAIREAMSLRLPVFITGPAGVGKSDIVHQLGKEQNRPVIDIRLALYDPTDIKGMPFFDSISKQMRWAPPSEFPSDPKSNAILFLDELPSAPPAVQAAAYQLILNRKVGEYCLPDGVDIVAAGNGEGDRGVVYKTPAPLCSRFVNLVLKANYESWFDWAIQNRIHKDVIGYITFAKQDLAAFDPQSPSRSFPCPRTWSFVSNIISSPNIETISEDTVLDLISGCIGDGCAVKFNAHRKLTGKLPEPMEVLKGNVHELDTKAKDISALYSLVISLCYTLKDLNDSKDKNFGKYVDEYIAFGMKFMEPEMVVLAMKVLIKQYGIHLDHKSKNFLKFQERYSKYMIAAFQ
jgi:hypothetical protein